MFDLTRYFDGRPCSKGHVAERIVALDYRLGILRNVGPCSVCFNSSVGASQKRRYDAGLAKDYGLAWWKKKYNASPEFREEMKKRNRDWHKNNPGAGAERSVRRALAKERRTPKWLTADDLELIRFFYEEANALSAHTGVKFHVDHIVPLRGQTVSGLHVPWNLQVIAATKNLSKGNKLL